MSEHYEAITPARYALQRVRKILAGRCSGRDWEGGTPLGSAVGGERKRRRTETGLRRRIAQRVVTRVSARYEEARKFLGHCKRHPNERG